MKTRKMTPKMTRLGLIVLFFFALALAFAHRQTLDANSLELWVTQAGIFGPLVFMAVYALATVLLLPGSVLTLTGGALFGPVWGTVYNLTGAVLGATLAFLIARYLAGDWVEKRISGQIKHLKQGVEAGGWRFIALVRLVPLLPFNLMNYGLGLTRISLFHYVLASYVFMLPGAVAYTYLGYAGREAIAGGEGAIQKGLFALSLLAMVAFLSSLTKRLNPITVMSTPDLYQRLQKGEALLVIDVRSQEEFWEELGHISGALNIPLGDSFDDAVTAQMEIRRIDKSHSIVMVCRTDRRSSEAAQRLMKSGFKQVSIVKGGMVDWQKNKFPVGRSPIHR